MGKAAAQRATTSIDPVDEKVVQASKVLAARQLFVTATVNMGLRLAITVVIPIVGGAKLDEHFKSSPLFTLIGMVIAAGAGSAAVWATIKQVNRAQAEEETADNMSKTKRKDDA